MATVVAAGATPTLGFYALAAALAGSTGVALILGLLLAGCWWFAIRRWMAYRAQSGQAARDLPAWQRAVAQWEDLSFCHRCDGVFTLGREGGLTPTPARADLLRLLGWREF